jgi:3-oxoacyl-[acyl-carrier protein] reductase
MIGGRFGGPGSEAAALEFRDITVGDTFELTRAFSEQDVDAFAALSGDFSPLHVDPIYAGESEFGRRVVHGMLLASLFSNLVGMRIPGRAALYLGQELTFRRPALINERLTARAKVTAKYPATSTISLAAEIRNAEGKVVVSGTGRVKVRGAGPTSDITTGDIAAPLVLASATSNAELPVAIVTGGVRGIGGAIARRLSREGYLVVAAYRANHEAANSLVAAITAEGGRCLAIQADVTQDESLDRLVSTASALAGPVRVAVNAAIGEFANLPLDQLEWRQFAAHLDTQVRAVLNLAKCVYPLMKEAGGGAIVNLLSQVVHNTPPKGMADYVTAKYALMGLSKALAAEWASDNVRVNMISPGLARTELTQNYGDRVFRMEALKTPLGRLVDPADVAEAVSYLVGAGAGFVTGVNLLLTGGQDMP